MTGAEPIVIVGGGIVGTSIAYHLRNADRPTILLEKNDLLGAGTTRESIAMLGLSYSAPLDLRRDALDHYGPLIEDGTIDFERIGTLKIRESPEAIAAMERTVEELDALGREASFLEPGEVREFGVEPPEGSTTLWIPDEGYLDPAGIIARWKEEARDAGVDIRTGTAVTDVSVADGVVTGVETTDGRIATDTVVNAAGQWAHRVNEMVGVSLPLRHNDGPILVLETDEEIALPNTSFPNGQYVRQEGRTQVFAGRHGSPWESAELRNPEFARSIPESFYLDVEELFETSLPGFPDPRLVNEWSGMRTITPDGLPIVGRTRVDGFVVACGLNGMGITLAPAVGERLAADLVGGDVDDGLRTLAAGRFDE